MRLRTRRRAPLRCSLFPPLDQDINFPFVPTCSVGAITAESSNVVYSTMEVNGNAESFNISLNCESGASLYLFECDHTPICATPRTLPSASQTVSVFLPPWTNVSATNAACSGVRPFDDRDPLGNWLERDLSVVGVGRIGPAKRVKGQGAPWGVIAPSLDDARASRPPLPVDDRAGRCARLAPETIEKRVPPGESGIRSPDCFRRRIQ